MLPTNSLFSIFAFSFGLAIGAVISPGPVAAAIITQSPRMGWVTGPLVSLGHALLELFMVMFILLGMSALFNSSSIQIAIALLGGALLMWMGGGYLLGAIKNKYCLLKPQEQFQTLSRRQIFFLGILTTISSPFWYAWWITIAATYLLQTMALGFMPAVAFYFGHISVDFVWNTLLSTVIGRRSKLLNDKVYNFIMGVCGLFLGYLGIQFFILGIRGLVG